MVGRQFLSKVPFPFEVNPSLRWNLQVGNAQQGPAPDATFGAALAAAMNSYENQKFPALVVPSFDALAIVPHCFNGLLN